MSKAVFLGTTTLKRMLKAAYNKYDPLYKSCVSRDKCKLAMTRVKEDPTIGEDVVFVDYYPDTDKTVMKVGEYGWGIDGASATFRGKIQCGLIRK
jgi:hypothetical protein